MRSYTISTQHKPYDLEKGRLVELERPAAYHTVTVFPPHTFRCDAISSLSSLAQRSELGPEISRRLRNILHPPANPRSRRVRQDETRQNHLWRVSSTRYIPNAFLLSRLSDSTAVLKITESRIVIAIDPTRSQLADFEFPERCRVLKLANSITYDREAFVLIVLDPN